MNKTVRNERRKLLATWYNNTSIAMIIAGIVTPFWNIIYGTTSSHIDDATRAAGFVICMVVSGILRYLADQTIGSLEE